MSMREQLNDLLLEFAAYDAPGQRAYVVNAILELMRSDDAIDRLRKMEPHCQGCVWWNEYAPSGD